MMLCVQFVCVCGMLSSLRFSVAVIASDVWVDFMYCLCQPCHYLPFRAFKLYCNIHPVLCSFALFVVNAVARQTENENKNKNLLFIIHRAQQYLLKVACIWASCCLSVKNFSARYDFVCLPLFSSATNALREWMTWKIYCPCKESASIILPNDIFARFETTKNKKKTKAKWSGECHLRALDPVAREIHV